MRTEGNSVLSFGNSWSKLSAVNEKAQRTC